MVKAFVFGKFLPFHKGHQAMIEFALSQCDFLTVLVCCSDQETIAPETRQGWLENTFEGEQRLEVRVFNYLESEYPNSSESSRAISAIWSKKFKELVPDCSLLVTSEPYGEYVAEFMGIQHIALDEGRHHVPISATAIRNNPVAHWEYLPEAVKPHYLQKVVLLGTESTGKTTLTQQLAKRFGAAFVLEAGRDLIEDSNEFMLQDLYAVAREHAHRIVNVPVSNSPLLFIDTDVHITQSYASFMFGEQLDLPSAIYTCNRGQLYLYLQNDVPHVQDGTRLSEEDRNALDASHRATLQRHGIDYHEISGNWQQRMEQAMALIDQTFFSACPDKTYRVKALE
ncbi:AAA family ATPase [Pontibacter ramchanderi]|uniref:HTH-type transcriptional regulator, transcriptional repressor of NAD biosynthesis genes n=1 Tax=Pontibacter ramchanderi TaxID=1179743 RepID=A0A2N3V0W1_9BACT|nr:AAA family ATPase [Pontibacter ramchanderi]PKV75271.1 HTH-type transcriptional regulator, transcriptional repressor of NAD biosynthesis genes [Pontibacter ramchanderi]